MMRSFASAAKLRGGVPILFPGAKGHRGLRVAPPRMVVSGRVCPAPKLSDSLLGRRAGARAQTAARRTTPSGTAPVVAKRHKQTNNLRASATTIDLRVVRAPSVRV